MNPPFLRVHDKVVLADPRARCGPCGIVQRRVYCVSKAEMHTTGKIQWVQLVGVTRTKKKYGKRKAYQYPANFCWDYFRRVNRTRDAELPAFN